MESWSEKILMVKRILHIIFLLLLVQTLVGQKVNTELRNQISEWNTANFRSPFAYQFGGRYIPELSVKKNTGEYSFFDAEFSLNFVGSATFSGLVKDTMDGKISPYRGWIRYSSSNWEIRAGLQKINFGSATILRPLMWFDRIDPRDPLQLTDGVYGLLGRYYFNNNANVWLWGLYGNADKKGWESIPSNWKIPEFGGRVQYPVYTGEMAFTYHHRQVDFSSLATDSTWIGEPVFPQNKIGVDGKLDLGIGLWFETVLVFTKQDLVEALRCQDYINLGMDYTFSIGNGVNLMAEYFRVNISNGFFKAGLRQNFSALSLNYPISTMDNISGILFYNWDNQGLYNFISYQRTYDLLTIYIMGFWNPETYDLYSLGGGQNLYAGKGAQLMFVLNF